MRSIPIQLAVAKKATLTKYGELIKVELLSGSGSQAFDEVLYNAVKKGGADQNPPAQAASADTASLAWRLR